MKIYLAGGMTDNWQDKVINALPHHTFFDPRSHGLTKEEEYTKWDLDAIRDSQLVLAYMNEANPSGFGVSLEIGFAYALNKVIIYVEEGLTDRKKYWGMARTIATLRRESLDEAIATIRALR